MTDAAIIAGLRAGETAAFDAAYERWRPRLHGFLLRLTSRRELAEDLGQETWLRLARHAARLAEETDLGAWLFTVARNLWRSHCRWAILDGERLRQLLAAPPRDLPTPLDEAVRSEAERHMELALQRLSPADREVLLLVAVEGLEQERAAAVLDLRPEALRQRLSRARARLEERLRDIEGGEDR